jgi:hypothetical protein
MVQLTAPLGLVTSELNSRLRPTAQVAAWLAALPVTRPSIAVGAATRLAHPAGRRHSLVANGVAIGTADDAVDGATDGVAGSVAGGGAEGMAGGTLDSATNSMSDGTADGMAGCVVNGTRGRPAGNAVDGEVDSITGGTSIVDGVVDCAAVSTGEDSAGNATIHGAAVGTAEGTAEGLVTHTIDRRHS